MNKRMIVSGIVAVLLGGGLVWAADREEDSGISGWETMDTSMALAVGGANTEEPLPAGKSGKSAALQGEVSKEGIGVNGGAKKPEQQHRLVILQLLEPGRTALQMLLTPLEEPHLWIIAGQERARWRQRRAHKQLGPLQSQAERVSHRHKAQLPRDKLMRRRKGKSM